MKSCKMIPAVFFLLSTLTTLRAEASLLDLSKLSTKNFLISKAQTGCMPKGMKIDPVGTSLYIAEMCGKIDPDSKMRRQSVSIFDLSSKKLLKTIFTPMGASRGINGNTEVEFSLDEQWAMITRSEGDQYSDVYKNMGMLTVVNADTKKIAKYIPLNGSGSKIIATRPWVRDEQPRKQIVYVANYFSDDISVVDVSKLKQDGTLDGSQYLLGKIPLTSKFRNPATHQNKISPRGIAFTPDGKYAFILNTESGSLIIVDSVQHKQIAELAPISASSVGRELNVRHIVISKDGATGYLSHMRGNAVSRFSVSKLISAIENFRLKNQTVLPAEVWNELLIPFNTQEGPSKIFVLEDYPKDHPNFPGKKWNLAHPNTIALDPVYNRYLYVSSRTTTDKGDEHSDPRIMGKIDIIDLAKDKLVFTLVGGAQPTALEVSRDNRLLMSAGLVNDTVYFFDLKKILDIYENRIHP